MPFPTSSTTPTSSSMQTSSSSSAQQPQPHQPPAENALNVFAQRLNNSAALCIEVGQYDRAIWSLQRALHLSEKHTHSRKVESETTQASRSNHCQECTLDGCIAFSEASSLFSSTSNSSSSSPNRLTATLNSMTNASATTTNTTTITPDHSNIVHHGKKRKISSSDANNSNNDDTEAVSTSMHNKTTHDDNGNYYVYRRPIRVPRQGLEMGSVLFLVILFNLALAHHLKATTISTTVHHRKNSSQSKSLAKTVDKALMLYQLVLEYWSKLQQRLEQSSHDGDADVDDDESRSCSKTNNYNSIWFRMILHNNLGHFYKWTENPTKENECLHDLLSAVLLVTDQAKQHGPGNGSVPTAMIADTNSNPNTSTSERTRARRESGFKRDLEGFLSNTAALTLHEQCAEAA